MTMKYMYFIVTAILVYAFYCIFLFWNAAQKSAPLIVATPPYNHEDPALTKSMLVLGDSLAVGVGAPPEATIAALLGKSFNANVSNFGKSGAQTKDLEMQLAAAPQKRFDLILIQIGANDIIQMRSLAKAEANMDRALAMVRKKSDRVVFLTSGNVGDAPLWPFPLPYLYEARTRDLRARFMRLAEKHDALYVDLYARGNIFASDPTRFYAADSLHLTSEGYAKWFEIISADIASKWPELVQ